MKTRTTVFSRKALEDVSEITLYIASGSLRAAEGFREALEHAYSTLEGLPHIGALRSFGHPRLFDVRMWPIPKFEKYLLLYRVHADTIEIVRVVHGARDLPALFEEDETEE
jgi:toxin ParE1/3/4